MSPRRSWQSPVGCTRTCRDATVLSGPLAVPVVEVRAAPDHVVERLVAAVPRRQSCRCRGIDDAELVLVGEEGDSGGFVARVVDPMRPAGPTGKQTTSPGSKPFRRQASEPSAFRQRPPATPRRPSGSDRAIACPGGRSYTVIARREAPSPGPSRVDSCDSRADHSRRRSSRRERG